MCLAVGLERLAAGRQRLALAAARTGGAEKQQRQ